MESEISIVCCHIIFQSSMFYCPATSLMLMTAASGKNFSFSIHVILRFVRSSINFIQITPNHGQNRKKERKRKNPSRVFFSFMKIKTDHDLLQMSIFVKIPAFSVLWEISRCCSVLLLIFFMSKLSVADLAGILSEYLSIFVS